MTLQRFLQWGAWLLVSAVAASTLLPIELRPTTAAPADFERFGAYAVIGAAFVFGYPQHRIRAAVLVLAVAGLLEVLQHVAPGRHGQVHDYAIKALGVIVGVTVASFLEWIIKRLKGVPLGSTVLSKSNEPDQALQRP